MDECNGEPSRRQRRASSPDPASFSAGLGLGLGLGVQSTTSTSNITMDVGQSQGQARDHQANASMPNISAPRSTSTPTFSSIGSGPSNSLIGAATNRGMFGRNIPVSLPAAARRSNSTISAGSSKTAIQGVQSHGQAGHKKPRTSGPSRSRASVTAPSNSTSNRPASAPTAMGVLNANTPTRLPAAAPATTNPFVIGFPAATPVLNSSSVTNNFNTLISQISVSSAQFRQQLHQQYAAMNIPPIQNPQQIMQRRALVEAQQQTRQRVGTGHKFFIQPVSETATTFHPFSRLPKELQLKIWKLMIPGPRIIELKPQTITMTLDDESQVTYDRCVSQASHPVLLHVCHDSRHLTKKIYQLCFEEELKWPVYMDPCRDILLLPDTLALDVFASAVPRADFSTPPSLAHIKYIVIDPKYVVASLPSRQRRSIEYTYPAYRFEEIAAVYGSLKEIVVLKYPANHHLAPLPPQLNQAGAVGRSETIGVENHLRMLLRWSLTMRRHGQPFAGGVAAGPVTAVNLPQLNQVVPAAGGGVGWLQGLLPGNGGPAQGQLMANGINGGVNQGLNAGMQNTPWAIPKIVAMTLDDLKERMERGEPEEENAVAQ